jgi:hypothetical protein
MIADFCNGSDAHEGNAARAVELNSEYRNEFYRTLFEGLTRGY